ncbi:MAG: hypothetical protein DME76_06760 [Verrucomicrobia bacterium]|nr:MAG: hypothetical protein DME76_06760 [Verrucomicrobiota bacterium]
MQGALSKKSAPPGYKLSRRAKPRGGCFVFDAAQVSKFVTGRIRRGGPAVSPPASRDKSAGQRNVGRFAGWKPAIRQTSKSALDRSAIRAAPLPIFRTRAYPGR